MAKPEICDLNLKELLKEKEAKQTEPEEFTPEQRKLILAHAIGLASGTGCPSNLLPAFITKATENAIKQFPKSRFTRMFKPVKFEEVQVLVAFLHSDIFDGGE